MPALHRIILRATLCAAVSAGPALAQDDLSVERVLDLWQRQKQEFSAARSGGLGKTRALTLVTVDSAKAEATGADTVVSAGAPAMDAPAEPATSAPAPAAARATAEPGAPMVIGRLDPELQVNLRIRFGFDSAALSDDQKPRLGLICQAMRQSNVSRFDIIGHTDTSGPEAYNERLSVLRAQEVARYLVEDCGIAAARLRAIGMGERFPFNTRDPGADENRRVEFQALG